MSSFFNSDIVQEELKEINTLQESIYTSVFAFSAMDRSEQLDHIEKLKTLLSLQQVMYTRLSLSDDPQAIEMKENLRKSIMTMGFPADTDVTLLFDSMQKTIEALEKNIDAWSKFRYTIQVNPTNPINPRYPNVFRRS